MLTPIPPAENRASRGQILIMFALFATAMFGVLGLAIDLGIAFAERRTMQNAADLGAIAGARAITRHSASHPLSAWPDVQKVVSENRMQSVPTITECSYLNDAGAALGPCTATVPAAATGVRVRVTESHSTFFMRVVPGAPNSVSTSATAAAFVQRLRNPGGDGPFIVCASAKVQHGSNSFKILNEDGSVNPAAYGKTFQVHGPQINRCGLHDSSWKGLAAQGANSNKSINEWWVGDTGTQAGPTRENVRGVEGCAQYTQPPYNCVMFLPVAQELPEGTKKEGSDPMLYVVKILPFRVTSCGANCHQGELLENYIVSGPSESGWCRECGDIAVIKLRQ